MSADDGSASSRESPERYRERAGELRALIASGVLRASETIEDLRQLAAWYDALAEHESAVRHSWAIDPTAPPPAPPSADEAPKEA